MKIVQKDDTVSSMEDSQQLLNSQDEKQAVTDVEIQSQNRSKEKKSRLQQDIDREILKAATLHLMRMKRFSFQLFLPYKECPKRKNLTFVRVSYS